MSQETVVVTGVAGFVGSHLAEALVAQGRRVVGVDNFDPLYERGLKARNLEDARRACAGGPGTLEVVEADVREEAPVRELLRRVRPASVVHLAARAGVRPSIADPVGYMRANVVATSVVLQEASAAGVARVVVASSSSVYGNCRTLPFHEGLDVDWPISPYAASKRACEILGWTHWKLTGTPVAMLRFFTVFGPRQRPDLAIQKFMLRVARGEPIEMYGNGGAERDFTYVGDVVRGVLLALDTIDAHGYRVWNLGSDRPLRLDALIERVARVVGRPALLEHRPEQPGDVERTWADLTRARAELGYAPATEFDDGLRAQWAWCRSAGLV